MSRFSTMGVKIHKQQVKELAELGIHNRKNFRVTKKFGVCTPKRKDHSTNQMVESIKPLAYIHTTANCTCILLKYFSVHFT